MSTFTITGTIDGDVFTVSWTDGELAGDAAAIGLVEIRAREPRAVWATPTGPHFAPGLEKPEAALLTCADVFDHVDEIHGDVTVDAELPKGAIA